MPQSSFSIISGRSGRCWKACIPYCCLTSPLPGFTTRPAPVYAGLLGARARMNRQAAGAHPNMAFTPRTPVELLTTSWPPYGLHAQLQRQPAHAWNCADLWTGIFTTIPHML